MQGRALPKGYSLTLFGMMPARAQGMFLQEHPGLTKFDDSKELTDPSMDFSLSDEQKLLQESLERFIQNDYQFESRQKIIASPEGISREHWNTFAQLGWLGMLFNEADGGFGGSAVDLMIIMEQVGKGLIVEPFVSSLVLAGGLIRRAGTERQKQAWLAPLMAAEKIATFAFVEPDSRFDLTHVQTRAEQANGGYRLNGRKAVVLNAQNADLLVVSARTSGETRDSGGISLFLVEADAEGVTRQDYPTIDGGRASEVSFEKVQVGSDAVLGEPDACHAVIERVVDEAILAVGAEAVGAMEVLYKATVDYSKQRKQFGVPIGSFQVLQHRMVDMFIAHEQAKSLMYMAAIRLDEDDDTEAKKAASAFKVQVGKSGKAVGQGAVQIHGGMGMTEELNVGHYFKRLTVIDTLFGNTSYHLNRFGALS